MEAQLVAQRLLFPNVTEFNASRQCNGTPGCDYTNGGEGEDAEFYSVSLFLSCVYTVFLFPVGFIGNSLILVVNLDQHEKMTIPDLYFVNLAAADLILVADSLIEVFNLNDRYYDIAVLCTFMSLFLQINMYSSIFFLTWMSFDRYLALAWAAKPSGPLRTMRHARWSCGLIWLAAVLAALGPFAVVQASHADEPTFCFADVPEIQWMEVTLGFVLPFSVIGLCYSLTVRVLVRAQKHRRLWPRRQRALRMIAVVVLVFFVCWLPENIFISFRLLQGQQRPSEALGSQGPGYPEPAGRYHPLVHHVVTLAAFSNSCLNPIIYSFLGETFRDKLRLYVKRKASASALYRLCSSTLSWNVPGNAEESDAREVRVLTHFPR
ncbi:G-protein coupled estrogen receptor 1-like [Callorhinchus milii]|uniref:G-protein coupled estrogen receptor 1-like n=1 Tax=Callorhinchus milii TaxID=7868 RepID=UPI00045762DB|nr:G-protein coupled estrogen receptor 1-like [Callorhinchus milii]|eukprot:gi/632970512/ref/XP_007901691.1/ PREDICTED: G-protein coupled estrogen receptor 1 [Callorhinchus milii]